MDAIKKFYNTRHYLMAIIVVAIGLALMMLLSACGSPQPVTADPSASAATVDEPEDAEVAVEAPPVNNYIKQFGEVVTYDTGVSISVAAVGPFTPTNLEYFPLGEGETAMLFKIVITNNSNEAIEPYAYPIANSGGKPATAIINTGNPEYGDVGASPMGTILPTQTLEWYAGFGVADPNNITLEISPTVDTFESAIFTNVPF